MAETREEAVRRIVTLSCTGREKYGLAFDAGEEFGIEVRAQIIADCEASSDPLAVAARLERAYAEVARLREALQMVQSYFWGTELPVMKHGDVQQFVEAALGKDGQ